MNNMLSISEIYASIQGEGRYAGIPTTFVRLQGCAFRCSWCDSAFTWQFNQEHTTSVEQVLAAVKALAVKYVCVTGGEPLQQTAVGPLFKALCDEGFSVSCETSGGMPLYRDAAKDRPPGFAIPIYVHKYDPRVHWVLDLKCPGSGMVHINKMRNLDVLRVQDQVKFVIKDCADFEWAAQIVHHTRFLGTVLFAPAWGLCDPTELVRWILAENFQKPHRLSLQQHKVIWDPMERGV